MDRVLDKLHHTPPPAAATHHPFTCYSSPIIPSPIISLQQIFLELVLVGKRLLLLQLAKTDRSPSGQQLLALLSMEQKDHAAAAAAIDDDSAASDIRARRCSSSNTILQKNAYALLRLKRYRDAAAVFLLTRPVPMVREACSVLSKQYRDPHMAFLVARRMEALTSGTSIALGPVARSILMHEILPVLQQTAAAAADDDDDTVGDTDHHHHHHHQSAPPGSGEGGSAFLATTSFRSSSPSSSSLSRSIVAMVASYWLQSRSALKTVMQRAVHPLMLVPVEEVSSLGDPVP